MTSYLKIFVLIDFHFQDAIFPFNRAAPYGMTSAVPREQGRTSARSAERPLALDPRPHSSAAARASLRFLVRSATERRISRIEISFQLPFKRYPIKNFGEQRYLRTSFDRPYKTVHARASRSTRQNANARLASRRDHHQRARHTRSRGHQEVPLQRRRSTTRTPQTEHGVVHRNHRKSAQQHGDVEAELDLRPNLIWE